MQEAFARMDELAGEGRLTEASRDWMAFFAADDEMGELEAAGYFEASGRYVPNLLEEIRQVLVSDEPGPTDPSVLAAITVPVLVLHGSRLTLDWYRDGIRHVAAHVADAEAREIAGAAHFAPWLRPQPVVDELVRFFAGQPALA